VIGKPLPFGKGFLGLVRYSAYGHAGEELDRVEWVESRNLPTEDPETAARLMAAYARQSVRTQRPVYHLVISADPGDPVDRASMSRVADTVLRELGLSEHQVLIIAHNDTAHPHMHLVVNRVHPETHRAWENGWDWPKIEKALSAEEEALGWRIVPRKRRHEPALVRGDAAFLRTVQEHGGPVLGRAASWAELEEGLAAVGLHVRVKGGGLSINDGRQEVKASEVAPAFSRKYMEARLGKLSAHRAERVREPEMGTHLSGVHAAPDAPVPEPIREPEPEPEPLAPPAPAPVQLPAPEPQPVRAPRPPVARVQPPAPEPQPVRAPEPPVARVQPPAPEPQPIRAPEPPVARVQPPAPEPQPIRAPEPPVARVQPPAREPQPVRAPEPPVARVQPPAPEPQPTRAPEPVRPTAPPPPEKAAAPPAPGRSPRPQEAPAVPSYLRRLVDVIHVGGATQARAKHLDEVAAAADAARAHANDVAGRAKRSRESVEALAKALRGVYVNPKAALRQIKQFREENTQWLLHGALTKTPEDFGALKAEIVRPWWGLGLVPQRDESAARRVAPEIAAALETYNFAYPRRPEPGEVEASEKAAKALHPSGEEARRERAKLPQSYTYEGEAAQLLRPLMMTFGRESIARELAPLLADNPHAMEFARTMLDRAERAWTRERGRDRGNKSPGLDI
jgi:hypothetical protein